MPTAAIFGQGYQICIFIALERLLEIRKNEKQPTFGYLQPKNFYKIMGCYQNYSFLERNILCEEIQINVVY